MKSEPTLAIKPGEHAEEFVGTFRTFGETGPLYEIVSVFDSEHFLIRTVFAGEEITYPIETALEDPVAE